MAYTQEMVRLASIVRCGIYEPIFSNFLRDFWDGEVWEEGGRLGVGGRYLSHGQCEEVITFPIGGICIWACLAIAVVVCAPKRKTGPVNYGQHYLLKPPTNHD